MTIADQHRAGRMKSEGEDRSAEKRAPEARAAIAQAIVTARPVPYLRRPARQVAPIHERRAQASLSIQRSWWACWAPISGSAASINRPSRSVISLGGVR